MIHFRHGGPVTSFARFDKTNAWRIFGLFVDNVSAKKADADFAVTH
jgi:hypothetical protein